MSTIIMRMSKAAPKLPTLEIDGEIVKGASLDFRPNAISRGGGDSDTRSPHSPLGLITYVLTVSDREILRTDIDPERSETEQEYIYTWQAHRYDITRTGDTETRYVYGPYASKEVT